MHEVTIAVAQMQPKLGAIEENLAKMANWVEKICLEQKTDIVIFPELATTGYECGARFAELAQRVPGHATNYLAERASHYDTHILFGMVEEGKPEGVIYNSAILLGPDGDVVHKYQKVHLKGEEKLVFRPGYRYSVPQTAIGPLGILIGWDLAFPEAARSVALQGADLICVCANWEKPHNDEWRIYNYARAMENSAYVAAANRVGEEYTYQFLGDSMVVGPLGETYVIIEAVPGEPTPDEPAPGQEPEPVEVESYAVVKVDLDQVGNIRDDFQLLQSRQPRSYREVVKMY
jgi:predicted amidohydrolase